MNAASQRVNAFPWPFMFGSIESYDSSTHHAVVKVDRGDNTTFLTEPCQIASPFWGPNYGMQAGPPVGTQVFIAAINPGGSQFVILGYTANDQDQAFSVPSDDVQLLDKRGSFAWWTAARGGALRLFGVAVATLFAPLVELGSENLDATNDAVVRKSNLDTALASLTAHVQTAIAAGFASCQPGGGVTAPTIATTTSTGSSKVKAAP